VDEGGSLRVGPQSAGSEPGPACYGRGGTEPTITDANLVLGRLNPSLNDKFALDRAAAEAAIDRLAEKIGLSRLETAEGMIKISCETMAQAVKGVVVARARDPRDFVLASFGGAGPMHATFVAQAMNIPKVVIPRQAGVASAFGATAMNIRHDIESFHFAPLESVDTETVNRLYAELEEGARARLRLDGIDVANMTTTRTAQMRYIGQTYEVETDIPSGDLRAEQIPEIANAFHAAHQREYGVSDEQFQIALVALGVTATGTLQSPPEYDFGEATESAPRRSRDVYFDGKWYDSGLYDGSRLAPGAEIEGPAVIEYLDSIAVVPPACHASMDRRGNLVVSVAQ
jgi:N-methylhydantoinase A